MTPGIMRHRWAGSITAALVLSLAVLAVGAGGAAAQDSSITLVSNMGQPTKDLPSERWDDRDHSQAFTTGAESSGYNITSVAFHIRIANSGGTTDPTYEVKIQAADNQGRPTGDSLGMFVRSDPLTAGVNTFSVDGSPIHLDPNTQYVLVFDFISLGTRRVRIRVTQSDVADASGAPSWSTADESLSRSGTNDFSTFGGDSLKFTISGYAGAAVRTVYDELEDYFSGTATLSQVEAALQADQTYHQKLTEIVEAGQLDERVPAGRTKWGTDGSLGWQQVGSPSLPNAWRMPDGTVRYNEDGPTCGGERQPALNGDDQGKFFWACTSDNQWVPVRLAQPNVDYTPDEDLVRPGRPGYNEDCRYKDEDGNPTPLSRVVRDANGNVTGRVTIHGGNWDPIAKQCTTRGGP